MSSHKPKFISSPYKLINLGLWILDTAETQSESTKHGTGSFRKAQFYHQGSILVPFFYLFMNQKQRYISVLFNLFLLVLFARCAIFVLFILCNSGMLEFLSFLLLFLVVIFTANICFKMLTLIAIVTNLVASLSDFLLIWCCILLGFTIQSVSWIWVLDCLK